ncbi:mis18-binding protein 1 isoform X1 [Xyrichtys novacula]|uniref:Mis18-binding protein 1 isoform X1 n=1 Tax=Xyrichtys novacula TaxID=13765 RepID=A0AAV1GLR1_XYRNO|nr:mis18-binding protein 1 isoform X1 [Xyrichtys novacula]
MASYHHILQHTKPQVESPAKVFAKLKSRVQREEMNANEKHGGGFRSPQKKPESSRITEELRENQRFGPYRSEAQVLTLSPISSPLKTCTDSYFDISRKHADEVSPWGECSSRKGAYMESTAVSYPFPVYNTATPIHPEPPQPRHCDGFMVTSNRTPVKMHSGEEGCRRRGYVEDDKPESPALLSPSRKKIRVRERKLEPPEPSSSSSTNKFRNSAYIPAQVRQVSSALNDHNAPMENLADGGGSPADPSGMNTFAHEPMLPPKFPSTKRCPIVLDKPPLMSPAKMFAYMKEKSKAEQQAVEVSSSTKDLPDECISHQSDETLSAALEMDGVRVFRDAVPADQSREMSAESHSDTDPSEDVQIPAGPSQPILLEDPVILKTPRISIPKKNAAVFNRNKWPGMAQFPSESVIHLKKWFLRKNHKGLFVDGIHHDENIPWNSNIIIDRVSNSVLKTVSGRVYILVGKMNLNIESEFPNWLLKKFINGFPANWKALYKKFLSERDRETTRDKEKKETRSKMQSEASSADLSVKQHKQNPLRTPASCPPAPINSQQVLKSRSGRTIRPPLEYWKGGRVFLDGFMNVTIHECYETSICNPVVTTTVSTKAPKEPVCVFLPCDEGQCETSSDKEAPVRKVKAQPRKSRKAKVCPKETPALSPEPSRQVSRHKTAVSSPPEFSTGDDKNQSPDGEVLRGRTKRQKVHTRKVRQGADKSKTNPEETPALSPEPSRKVSRHKTAVSSSPEISMGDDKSLSPNSEVLRGRTKRQKVDTVKGRKGADKSKTNPEETPALSPEPSRKVSRRKTAVSSSPEFSTGDDKSQSPNGEVLRGRTRRQKVHTRKGRQGTEKSKTNPEETPALSPEPSRKVSRRKTAVSSSPEFSTGDDKSQSPNGEVLHGRTRRQKVATVKGRQGADKSKTNTSVLAKSSSESPEDSPMQIKRTTKMTQKKGATQTKRKQGKSTKISPPAKLLTKSTQSIEKQTARKSNLSDEDRDTWTEAELIRLQEAASHFPKHKAGYWAKVARMVGTRSAEECHSQHTSQGTYQSPSKKPTKLRKEKVKAPKDPDQPAISSRVGTLRRKQEVRQFLEAMPKEDVDDVFTSAYMKNRRFEMPSLCSSEDHDFALSDLEPLTPRSTAFPEVMTPQCLLITPGMMGSPNRSNDDKYVYQLQKRIKKNRFNVCSKSPSSKKFTHTPSAKQTMKSCGNTEGDTFVVWKMFPENDVAQSDSEEEADCYFSVSD